MTEQRLDEIQEKLSRGYVPYVGELLLEVRRLRAILEDLRNLFPKDVDLIEAHEAAALFNVSGTSR